MTLAEKFELWLDQAYHYYHVFDNHLLDYEWDAIGRELHDKWDEWDHKYKHLIHKDDMHTGFYIDFPDEVKHGGSIAETDSETRTQSS